MNHATLVILRNPFRPAEGREVRAVKRRSRVAALAPRTAQPFICLLNGQPLLRPQWKTTRVKRGDLLSFILLPQGGGGGGSNPLRMVLMIAVMVAAPQLAAWGNLMTGGALGAAGSASFSLATAAIGMVGTALVNAVLPPPRSPSNQQAAQLAAPSPTYSLPGQQGNQARIGAAIPVLYGRHMIFPDYAAMPFYEYSGNEQFGHFLFCLGQGMMEVEQIRFDKTDASAYGSDVVLEVVNPGGAVTLFPTNVVTSTEVSGQELPGRKDVTYSQAGTTITLTEAAHGRTAGSWVSLIVTSGAAVSGDFAIVSTTADTWTVAAAAALTASGNVQVLSYLGGTGFVVNAAGTAINQIAIDVILPSGLGLINQSNGAIDPATVSFYIEAEPIDANGNSTGPWVHLPSLDPAHRFAVTAIQPRATRALDPNGDAYVTTPSVLDKIALGHATTAGQVLKRAGVVITGWTISTGTGAGGVDEILIPTASQRNSNFMATVAWEVSYTTPITVLEQTITANTNTPQRRTYYYQIAQGRYRVRLARLDVKNTATTALHTLLWGGLKGYFFGSQQYGDVTMMAMRIRASAMTSTAAQKVNVIATRSLPVWDAATGWSAPQPTQSIAWALADAARAQYGGRLLDAQLDLPALAALDAVWEARGDSFNGIFDNAVSLWEAFTSVLRAGRAKPLQLGGVLTTVRDQARAAPVALFSMRNIARGSFSVDYAFPNEATTDSVEVTYFDEAVWAQRTVMATLPGGTANNPAKIQAFGMTGRDQAHREGLYMAACNRYRRRAVKFNTEMEGFVPIYGDLIAVQHDMPGWGQHGEVIAYDHNSAELTLSDELTWLPGAPHYLGFRRRDGSLTDAVRVEPGSAPDRVILMDALPIAYLDVGSGRERTHISFGPGEAWRQNVVVTQVTPRGMEQVEIACVSESAIVHTVENDVPTPPWVGW